MNQPQPPQTITRYQIQKGKIVRFSCPACKDVLNTELKDAGKTDHCPTCGIVFISPGVKDLEILKEAQRAKLAQLPQLDF